MKIKCLFYGLNFVISFFCFSYVFANQDSTLLPNKLHEGNLIKDSSTKIVYKFNINDEIGPAIWRQTQQSIDEAVTIKANYILIHMNTYGGMVLSADSIRTKILNCPIPVIVFIDNNAASAGALISIACDSIYMRKGANIGAATVVDQSGKAMPDKYQSYMRSMMRSTAESHGKIIKVIDNDTITPWFRDPKIAESMVDPSVYIEGIIDTGKVLTFTTSEAIKYNFCEGEAENITEVLQKAGIKNYKIVEYKLTTIERIIGWLISPYLQGLLIMIIIGGIYFELQTPGIGFPLAASITAAVLYFAPLYLEGLAENWEIIIFFIGVALLAVEIFAIPGFGIAGVTGIFLMVLGLSLALINNYPFELSGKFFIPVIRSVSFVIVCMAFSVALSIYITKKMFDTRAFSFLSLSTVENSLEGFMAVDNLGFEMIGKEGVAYTLLRPSGKVDIEGKIYDAKALTGYIEKGEKIKVVKYETGQVYVKLV